ncbi:MAG: glycosyltransferase [Candidatus Ventricola sp.]
MKRILFFSHGMELGGAERALVGLLEHIDYTKVQVELFLMHREGELLSDVPKQVKLLPEMPQYASLAVPLGEVIRKRQLRVAAGRALGKALARRRVRQLGLPEDNGVALEYSHKYTLAAMPPVGDGEYDLAVSFLTPHYFVANRVKAKKKVAWIHTDYSKVAIDVESEVKMWSAYDAIISISEEVSRTFVQAFPTMKDKLICIGNMLPAASVERQIHALDVSEEMPEDGAIRLLSVGRFCTAKNFDNVPDICRRLRESGLNVRWYLIGYGGDEPLIRQRIAEAGMQAHVVILGKKSNPYPYIKACDLYVQPSRYEGKCVTVREAQMLGRPVVITNYATAPSQLEDGADGVVVPMDNKGCAEGIAALLRDPKRMASLMQTCRERDYSNAGEVEKLYQLME